MDELPPRVVTLVLCRGDGQVLGSLPPFTVDVPWWQEAGPVVRSARERFGVDVTVLRLLEAAEPPAGGPVTYLAEVGAEPRAPLAPWDGAADGPEPLRAPYARPGGPRRDLAWADEELAARGTPRAGPAEQIRTWNLSSLWRLPLAAGAAWLKVVPPFFAHEGAMLARLDPALVPPLIAAEAPRILLEEVPGEDQHEAPLPRLKAMVTLLVGLQAHWAARLGELADVQLPDWRPVPFTALAARVVERTAPELEPGTRAALARLLDGLPARFAALAACGIPDSLVHGDFHPGNVRGDEHRLVLLDWGDCGLGHPLLDQAAFLTRIPPATRSAVRAHWARSWREAVPGADADRAAALLTPVAALRQATSYLTFLDRIEPAEHVYHAGDPADWLRRAAAAAF
jgi:phosphotransferase family enzyme